MTQEQDDWAVRGQLAAKLTCWHRLTESEADELVAFAKSLRAPQPNAAADGWMPIETAPKDGTPLLLRSSKGRIADGCWMAATNSSGAWLWAYVKQEPVEWMHLPDLCATQMLRSALSAMLTHMGMDEDEWNKPTFDQARRALSFCPAPPTLNASKGGNRNG